MEIKINLPFWNTKKNLAATVNTEGKKTAKSYNPIIVEKSISQTRQDIRNWTEALNLAQKAEDPKRYPLYNLYDSILLDLHLKSQINNRILKSLSQSFVIRDINGETNLDLTNLLQNQKWIYEVNKSILDTVYYGHSLGEFNYDTSGKLTFNLIPRQNIDPVNGLIYYDYTDDKKIKYREQKEYGQWLIEFGEIKDLGLLNGCVPHVLFKRFAQSCWSELCEIYGIPPRVMKTNTQDRLMVSRAEKMMKEMGAAAWFIIDDSEKFEFAKGVDTNGDVYSNLITLCNNEISMAVSGAVLGQDTKNGSNSKEKTSAEIQQDLVDSDLALIEQYWNERVIPALQKIGVLPLNITYGYDPSEDLESTWKKVTEALPYYEINPEWIKNKFGIEVEAKKQANPSNTLSLNLGEDFFV